MPAGCVLQLDFLLSLFGVSIKAGEDGTALEGTEVTGTGEGRAGAAEDAGATCCIQRGVASRSGRGFSPSALPS